jgi:hypothetical protein
MGCLGWATSTARKYQSIHRGWRVFAEVSDARLHSGIQSRRAGVLSCARLSFNFDSPFVSERVPGGTYGCTCLMRAEVRRPAGVGAGQECFAGGL